MNSPGFTIDELAAVAGLLPREAQALEAMRDGDKTLRELGRVLGVTRQRAQQLRDHAFARLRRAARRLAFLDEFAAPGGLGASTEKSLRNHH